MGTIKKRPLNAYVRYDGSGRIVAGSLVLRRKMPKNGRWVQIDAYECCNGTTTTTTTTLPAGCFYVILTGSIVAPTVWNITFCGDLRATEEYTQTLPHEVWCVTELPTLVSGTGSYVVGEACEATSTTTTTSTTAAPTTTTTTTAPA